MKKFILLLILTSISFANCPQLQGDFICGKNAGDTIFSIESRETAHGTLYKLNGKPILADGNKRSITGSNSTETAVCNDSDLTITTGSRSSDNALYAITYTEALNGLQLTYQTDYYNGSVLCTKL